MRFHRSSRFLSSAALRSALSFEKKFSIGIEVRGIRRQEEKVRPAFCDGIANFLLFLAPQIVHDDCIARPQHRDQAFPDMRKEDEAVHDHRSDNPVMAHSRNKN